MAVKRIAFPIAPSGSIPLAQRYAIAVLIQFTDTALSINVADSLDNWADILALEFGLILEEDLNNWIDSPGIPLLLDAGGDDLNNWIDEVALSFLFAVTIEDSLNNWGDNVVVYYSVYGTFNYTVNESDTLNNWLDSLLMEGPLYIVLAEDNASNLTDGGVEFLISISKAVADQMLMVDNYRIIYGRGLEFEDILELTDDGGASIILFLPEATDSMDYWADFIRAKRQVDSDPDNNYYRRYLNDVKQPIAGQADHPGDSMNMQDDVQIELL